MKATSIQQATAFGRVAVLMGGTAAERNISLNSGNAVYQALLRKQVDVTAVDVKTTVLDALAGCSFDRVVNMIHGRGGEDGVLQGVLDTLKLSYTGSGVLASALSMDKLRTKLCWKGAGLTSPEWVLLQSEADIQQCIDKLNFPVIVKPALEGSSLGVSKAENREQLIKAWKEAEQYQCDVYAETWVNGQEYTIGILNGETLPIIRLETPHTFYDYGAKYQTDTTRYHCPSGLSQKLETELAALSLRACHVLGVSGWGRVDLFIEQQGQIQLIEVNTVPGMTDHSLVPMAAKQAGLSFEDLAWRILETSYE